MSTTEQIARFDVRLPKEQKLSFEKAARLGGFRNLTDFVIWTLNQKAKSILEEQEQIIASERDKEIFFNLLTNPEKPNQALLEAKKEYKKKLSGK